MAVLVRHGMKSDTGVPELCRDFRLPPSLCDATNLICRQLTLVLFVNRSGV